MILAEMTVSIERIATIGLEGGFIAALAMVCLLQYIVHLYRRRNALEDSERLRRELNVREIELSGLQSDTALAQLENRILREFIAERDVDVAVNRLLRYFCPEPSTGFAAMLVTDTQGLACKAVGVTPKVARQFRIEPHVLVRLKERSVLCLKGIELTQSSLYAVLDVETRRHVHELYLVHADLGQQANVVLVATSLFPASVEFGRRRDLASRLVSGIGCHVRRTVSQEAQEQELRVTREILELRSIADLHFQSPLEMLQEFLGRLAAVTGFHQVSLYLSPKQKGEMQMLIRHSSPLSRETSIRWSSDEHQLTLQQLETSPLYHFDSERLQDILQTRDLIFQEAVVVPMTQQDQCVGLLCLSRAAVSPLHDSEYELLLWASNYLLETLLRTADRAVIEKQARRDALTGLENRHSFDTAILEHLQHALRTGKECALVLLDLDHFKLVNDRYGHLAGDEALRTVARIIQEHVRNMRSTDRAVVARYGGEELAIILPGIGLGGAMRIGEMIREEVEQTLCTYDQVKFNITLSGGVAVAPMHARGVKTLISLADQALYQAKTDGRNRINSATPQEAPTPTH